MAPNSPGGCLQGLPLGQGHWGHSKWVPRDRPPCLGWWGPSSGWDCSKQDWPLARPPGTRPQHRPHCQPRCRMQLTGQRGAEAAPEPLCPPSLAASCPPASNSGPCPRPHKQSFLAPAWVLAAVSYPMAIPGPCACPEWTICSSAGCSVPSGPASAPGVLGPPETPRPLVGSPGSVPVTSGWAAEPG